MHAQGCGIAEEHFRKALSVVHIGRMRFFGLIDTISTFFVDYPTVVISIHAQTTWLLSQLQVK